MFFWVILTRTHCPQHHSFASSKDPHLTCSNLPLWDLNSCEQFRMRIHGPLVALTPAPLPWLPGTATSYATGQWNFLATFQVLPSVGLLGLPPDPWPWYIRYLSALAIGLYTGFDFPPGQSFPSSGGLVLSPSLAWALFGLGVGRGALQSLGDFICFIVKVLEESGWEGSNRHWGRIGEPTTGESPGWVEWLTHSAIMLLRQQKYRVVKVV